MNLFDDLPSGVCRRNVPLGPLTWFKIGGPAEYLVEPKSERQFATVVRRCREHQTPIRLLGQGANVLVPDEGVCGVVVRLCSTAFASMDFDGERLVVGAGADLTKLVRSAIRRGLGRLEPLTGIPGTVGGGIAMNCGGRFGDISTALESIRVMSPEGKVSDRRRADLNFAYRECDLGGDIVLEAAFRVRRTDPDALHRRFREIWMYKQNTQPNLSEQSVGCIFRNPNGCSAGELIDRAGLKGFRIGTAAISEHHGNFALADRAGRASDVSRLIREVADRVVAEFGVRLEPEVRIW